MQITKENLTIIIVTIKSEKIIDNCLQSINPEVKKIVVENSSNQEFANSLKKKYENLECYTTGKNLGMGQGNNFGIEKSKTRYVMILNPDTVLQNNTLNQIYKVSLNLDFAILSPSNYDKNFPNYKAATNIETTNEELIEVDSIDGYAMILDKKKFDGFFFDTKIFMYLENDDLCLRMKRKGEKIYISKNSQISHLGAKAVDPKFYKEIELSRNWHWSWSKFYFRRKHYGYFNAMIFSFPSFFKSCIKSFFYFMTKNEFKCKLYSQRASGIINSFLMRDSWYRPKLD
tara:strand:+ start:327 stop:1187 length:861 start_codon:yes stop_codon:yes gene_type:complete